MKKNSKKVLFDKPEGNSNASDFPTQTTGNCTISSNFSSSSNLSFDIEDSFKDFVEKTSKDFDVVVNENKLETVEYWKARANNLQQMLDDLIQRSKLETGETSTTKAKRIVAQKGKKLFSEVKSRLSPHKSPSQNQLSDGTNSPKKELPFSPSPHEVPSEDNSVTEGSDADNNSASFRKRNSAKKLDAVIQTLRKTPRTLLSEIQRENFYFVKKERPIDNLAENLIILMDAHVQSGWDSSDEFRNELRYAIVSELEAAGFTVKSKHVTLPIQLLTLESVNIDQDVIGALLKYLSDFTCDFVKQMFMLRLQFEEFHTSVIDQVTDFKPRLYDSYKKIIKSLLGLRKTFMKEIDASSQPCIKQILERLDAQLEPNFKGEILELDNEFLQEGQCISFAKEKLRNSFLLETNSVYFTCSALLSALKTSCNSVSDHLYHICLQQYFAQILKGILSDVETYYMLLSLSQNAKPRHSIGNTKKNSWLEPDEVKSPDIDLNNNYRPGTLNNLIIRLTSPMKNSNDFVQAFLNGYTAFCSPYDLWKKIQERFYPPNSVPQDKQHSTRVKASLILNQWVQNDKHMFDRLLYTEIETFAKTELPKWNLVDAANELRKSLKSQGSPKLQSSDFGHLSSPQQIPVFGLDPTIHPFQIFNHVSTLDIAQQITSVDFEIFKRIEARELIGQKWSKKKQMLFARNVSGLLNRINKIAHWTATLILLREELESRTKQLSQMITLAKHLLNWCNFNGFVGVMTGLNMACISRLRKTFSGLSKKAQDQFKEFTELQSPTNTFRNLRNMTHEAGGRVLPYLGIYLSDLTLIDDGNNDTITINETELINLEKHNMIQERLNNLLVYQQASFNFQRVEPLYTFLFSIPSLSEDELYNLSLEREPREKQ